MPAISRALSLGGLSLLIFLSCRNPNRLGEAIYPPPSVRADTLPLTDCQNVFLPPQKTEKAPFVFVGEVADTLVGTWQAEWATQFALGGTNVQLVAQQLVAVDSVVLDLFIASSYGDISMPLAFRVYRLTQPLVAGTSYDAHTTFSNDGTNLVLSGGDTVSYATFTPGAKRLRLDTALGRYLLTLPPSALANQSAFSAAFAGLHVVAVSAEPQKRGVMYTLFPRSALTALRVYYREQIQGQEVPQQYSFLISDSCVWAYRLVRQTPSPPYLRDLLEQETGRQDSQLLLAGGEPVGVRFRVEGWERLVRGPVLAAKLILPAASGFSQAYSPFFPRPSALSLYADTLEEVATANWGVGDFVGDSVVVDVTTPVQGIVIGQKPPPAFLAIWLTGRQYTLTRWVLSGSKSAHPPYLVVISASP